MFGVTVYVKNILNEAIEVWEIEDFNLHRKRYRGAYIYCLYNKINSKIYIGSSSRFVGRFSNYYRAMNGTAEFHSILLKRVFKKYNKSDFLLLILEKIEDKGNIVEREQFYLDAYQPFGTNGYNIAPLASSNFGIKHSEETRKNASLRWQGEKSCNAKLKNKDIIEIFNDFALLNLSYGELAEKYGISKRQLSEVLSRNQWSHIMIENEVLEKVKHRRNKILSKEDALLIGRRLKSGEAPKNLSLEFDVPIANIHNINRGQCFPEIKNNLSPESRYIYDFKPKNTRDDYLWEAIKKELKLNKRRCEIVRELNVSKSLVSEVKKSLNVQKPQKNLFLENALLIGNLLLSGLEHREIANVSGFCKTTVSRINKGILFPEVKYQLVRSALYIKPPKKVVMLSVNKKLVKLIKGGYKDNYILSQVPISRSHLVKWRKKYRAKHSQGKYF